MTETEVIKQAKTLPDRYATRIAESTLWSIRAMAAGGEYGEMTIELAASLAADKTPVTMAERDELLALLEAMGMPTEPVAQLNVQA